MSKREHIATLGRLDVGKSVVLKDRGGLVDVTDAIGRVLPGDVGKRLYQVGEIVQCESAEQRDERYKTPAETLHEAYNRAETTYGEATYHEVTEAAYYEGLEVVPPIYGRCGRFWVGEMYTSDEDGRAVSLEFDRLGAVHRCRLSPVGGKAVQV